MNKCIRIMEFAEQLFDQPKVARQAGAIMQAILTCQSPRISDIAGCMVGSQAAAYKRVQRFLQESEPKEALRLLFNQQAEFIIGDPTEIERSHARKTSYGGTLKDGKTRGFQMLNLGSNPPHFFLRSGAETRPASLDRPPQ